MIIYKTTNLISGKIYIGQDKYNNPNYYGSGKIFLKALRKYGKENFSKDIIEYCYSIEHLNEREIYWIACFNSRDRNIGYNITKGGEIGFTGTHSLETKEKIKIARAKQAPTFLGKHHTLETKEKIRKANRGKQSRLGHKATEETKKKLRESHLGIKRSEESRKKGAEANRGKKRKPFTNKARMSMSASHMGNKPSEETKAKMSVSQMRRRHPITEDVNDANNGQEE